jgi:hypothetical protein
MEDLKPPELVLVTPDLAHGLLLVSWKVVAPRNRRDHLFAAAVAQASLEMGDGSPSNRHRHASSALITG